MFRTFCVTALVATGILSAELPPDRKEKPSTQRELQFENEHVKVWKTTIMPDQPLKMHRHDCSRVVVGLKGGILSKIEETGERTERTFEAGKAYWLTPDPVDKLHACVNETNEPIEVMVIELKQAD